MNIVLASTSPRRNEILTRLGIPFTRIAVSIEEENLPKSKHVDVGEIPLRNALLKARAAALALGRGKSEETAVIGADTVVVVDCTILPKPADDEDARRMLRMLSGREHLVITGVAVVLIPSGSEITGIEETKVKFRPLTEEEVSLYISTGESADKAGAYGIQGCGSFLVEGIVGDYQNVVGLPIVLLYNLMKEAGADLFKIAARSISGNVHI